jgi:hypothetical protein
VVSTIQNNKICFSASLIGHCRGAHIIAIYGYTDLGSMEFRYELQQAFHVAQQKK